MKPSEIAWLLLRKRITPQQAVYADAEYSLPDRAWINGSFAKAYRKLLFGLNLMSWTRENHDCDDFARLAAAFAGILHARHHASLHTALAFGEFWYHAPIGPHAINIAITLDAAGERDLLFWEPQTRSEIPLTQQEIQSCFRVRF